MHRLLERQLKRHTGSVESIPKGWQNFIDAVNKAYRQSDADRALVERSLDLTSEELLARNQQLWQQIAEQEQARAELERRALQLSTAAKVSRAASSILGLDELLPQVVELIRDRFGFYYVGIFLVDEERQYAVLRVGTGEAGRQMVAEGHRLKIGGESMIGWCVANKQARIVLDVGEEAVRFDNPLLPETHSEMALPLISRKRVIGAVTVQSVEKAAFSDADVAVLQTMADQVANAIQNTRLFEQAQTALAQTDTLYTISRGLNAADDEDEMLRVLARSGMEAGAHRAELLYIDPNEAGALEWLEVVAVIEQHTVRGIPPPSVGTRYYIPEFAFADIFLANPDEPLFIADPTTDERVDEMFANVMAQIGARATVIIPLIQSGRWIGYIAIYWDSPHEFSKQEVEIYRALTDLAAPAVASRRLLVEQERALTETLYTISRGLNAADDEDEMLQILAQPAIKAGVNSAHLLHFDIDEAGEPEWAETVAGWYREGEPRTPIGSRFYLPELPFAKRWIASPDEVQLIADAATDERVDEKAASRFTQSVGGALVIVPLKQVDRWVGVITFVWDEPREFSEREVEIYNALIDLASPAVASRRQFKQTQARARREQILREITSRVRSFTNPDAVVRAAVRELGAALGRSTFVRLGSAEELSQTPITWTEGGDGRDMA